ncbi:VOC family protein [Streptomyces capparidis]
MARDLDAAQSFYGALLGWQFKPGPHRLGAYVLAIADGDPVAGIGAMAQDLGFPVSWTAYFSTTDANRTAERVRERGATVAVGPVDFVTGRVAWAADPAGAAFGCWEGDMDPGWAVRRSPGHLAWLELRTRDAFAAAMFYGEVFGWDRADPDRYEMSYEHDRVILNIDGHRVAGLFSGAVEAAPDPRVRPRWQLYFGVPDVDAAAARAVDLGGRVEEPPADSPYGRTATLRDAEGGLFSVTGTE